MQSTKWNLTTKIIIYRYEDYKNPRIALYITLFRTFLLEVIVVGVLITFWLTHSEEDVSTLFCLEVYFVSHLFSLFIDFIFYLLAMLGNILRSRNISFNCVRFCFLCCIGCVFGFITICCA